MIFSRLTKVVKFYIKSIIIDIRQCGPEKLFLTIFLQIWAYKTVWKICWRFSFIYKAACIETFGQKDRAFKTKCLAWLKDLIGPNEFLLLNLGNEKSVWTLKTWSIWRQYYFKIEVIFWNRLADLFNVKIFDCIKE